jgi:hypothetical protein
MPLYSKSALLHHLKAAGFSGLGYVRRPFLWLGHKSANGLHNTAHGFSILGDNISRAGNNASANFFRYARAPFSRAFGAVYQTVLPGENKDSQLGATKYLLTYSDPKRANEHFDELRQEARSSYKEKIAQSQLKFSKEIRREKDNYKHLVSYGTRGYEARTLEYIWAGRTEKELVSLEGGIEADDQVQEDAQGSCKLSQEVLTKIITLLLEIKTKIKNPKNFHGENRISIRADLHTNVKETFNTILPEDNSLNSSEPEKKHKLTVLQDSINLFIDCALNARNVLEQASQQNLKVTVKSWWGGQLQTGAFSYLLNVYDKQGANGLAECLDSGQRNQKNNNDRPVVTVPGLTTARALIVSARQFADTLEENKKIVDPENANALLPISPKASAQAPADTRPGGLGRSSGAAATHTRPTGGGLGRSSGAAATHTRPTGGGLGRSSGAAATHTRPTGGGLGRGLQEAKQNNQNIHGFVH